MTILVIGCKKDDEFFNEGQIWTEKHIRYQCTSDGTLKVLGELYLIALKLYLWHVFIYSARKKKNSKEPLKRRNLNK